MITHSGGVPVFMEKNKLKIVLVSNRNRTRWIIPKGYIDPGHTPKDTALTEAWEEGGIMGRIIGKSLGTYKHPKLYGNVFVKLFIIKVLKLTKNWPEKEMRTRRIVSLKKAEELIDIPDLKKLIHNHFKQIGENFL